MTSSDKPSTGASRPEDRDPIAEREVVSIGDGIPVGDVVSVGDVSDEIREELARLFGSSSEPASVADEPTSPESPSGSDDVTAEVGAETTHDASLADGTDGVIGTVEVSESDPDGESPTETRVQRFARRRRERLGASLPAGGELRRHVDARNNRGRPQCRGGQSGLTGHRYRMVQLTEASSASVSPVAVLMSPVAVLSRNV